MGNEPELLAKLILERYLNDLSSLSVAQQTHFLRRAYRLTGERRFAEMLAGVPVSSLVPLTGKSFARLRQEFEKRGQVSIPTSLQKKVPRKQMRYDGYMAKPEMYFLVSCCPT